MKPRSRFPTASTDENLAPSVLCLLASITFRSLFISVDQWCLSKLFRSRGRFPWPCPWYSIQIQCWNGASLSVAFRMNRWGSLHPINPRECLANCSAERVCPFQSRLAQTSIFSTPGIVWSECQHLLGRDDIQQKALPCDKLCHVSTVVNVLPSTLSLLPATETNSTVLDHYWAILIRFARSAVIGYAEPGPPPGQSRTNLGYCRHGCHAAALWSPTAMTRIASGQTLPSVEAVRYRYCSTDDQRRDHSWWSTSLQARPKVSWNLWTILPLSLNAMGKVRLLSGKTIHISRATQREGHLEVQWPALKITSLSCPFHGYPSNRTGALMSLPGYIPVPIRKPDFPATCGSNPIAEV